MAEDQTALILLVIVAVVAVVGLALSVASFATDESMTTMMGPGGGMMQNHTTTASTPGAFEWAVLILSTAVLVVVLALILRGRTHAAYSPAVSEAPQPVAVAAPSAAPPVASAPAAALEEPTSQALPPAAPAAVGEPVLVRLLSEDERRMYLELRDHGGMMLQRDIVALGIFSKAKVTRVLDRLEAKGIVVREAHGMTNRVRIVVQAPR